MITLRIFFVAIILSISNTTFCQYWETVVQKEEEGKGVSLIQLNNNELLGIGNKHIGEFTNMVLMNLSEDGQINSVDEIPSRRGNKLVKLEDNTVFLLHKKSNGVLQLSKIGDQGNFIWTLAYENIIGTATDIIELVGSGGYLLTGVVPDAQSAGNLFTLKLDFSGNIIDYHEYDDGNFEVPKKIFAEENNYYIAGYRRTSNPTVFQPTIWKTDLDGEILEEIPVPSTNGYFLSNVTHDNENNFYFTGTIALSQDFDAYICKTDLSGDVQWINYYNASDEMSPFSEEIGDDILINDDGNVVLLTTNIGDKRLNVYEISDEGEVLNYRECGHKNDDRFKWGVQITQSIDKENYFIIGTIGSIVDEDYYILSVPKDLTLSTQNESRKEAFLIYPNPVENEISLDFNETVWENELKYEIRDSFGRLIEAGTLDSNSAKINLNFYQKGVYILNCFDALNNYKSFKFIKGK